MKFPRGSRSDVGFQTSSGRVVDDPHNYAKELPVRKSRNPKPQYKMPSETLSVLAIRKPKATGRGSTSRKVLTPRRKVVITGFMRECSLNPRKYGRIGSMHWVDELVNQINTPGTGRGSSQIGIVSHSDVQIWLDHADIVDLYENLKETQNQPLEPVTVPVPVQPIPGTSDGVAKDKEHVAPLPPKKRVRISSPTNWEYIPAPPNSSRSSFNGLLQSTTERDPLNGDDGDSGTKPPLASTPSSSTASDGDRVPVQSSCYTSSFNTTGKREEVSPVRVTIIKKKLSGEDLREEAAAVSEQLASNSVVHQGVIVQNVGLSDGLADLITGQVKEDEYILPTGDNVENQGGQLNMNQDESFGIYHQNDIHSNQELNVAGYERFDFQMQQQQQQSTFSMQGMNPFALEQQVPVGVNYNGVLAITQGGQVPFKSVNLNCPLPAVSPDLSSFGPLNLVQNLRQRLTQSESMEEANEERRLEAVRLHEAFGTLHNSIDSVRQALNDLYALNYQRRAAIAMDVFGYIVDSMVSFYTNYLRPDGQ